uniref:Uncharacterized protein n=1 Tax=Sphaerodactylus townsendi TaxID=933632 RepID=A0ACB8END9_9SAUR
MISLETQPGCVSTAADSGRPIPEDLTGTLDSIAEPTEGPRMPLEGATGRGVPTPGGFLDSINPFMTAPLDGSQEVTVHRRRGLDYRESQPSGFGSATWATAPLAGNVSLPARRKGLIYRKLKLGGCSRRRRRPGIRNPRHQLPRLQFSLHQPRHLLRYLLQCQHQLQFLLQHWCQPSLSNRDSPQRQYQLSLLNRHQSWPQLQFLLQHQDQLSLFTPDPLRLQFQCQASRLSSRPPEASPCCQLHLLRYQSHPMLPFMPPGWGAPGGVLPNFAPYGVAPPPFMPRVRLTTRFDGTQDLLPAFLVQVNAHTLHYGWQYLNNFERVCEIESMLDGPAANWYVRLFQHQAAELCNFQDFRLALRRRFESPFVGEQSKQELLEIRQGKLYTWTC